MAIIYGKENWNFKKRIWNFILGIIIFEAMFGLQMTTDTAQIFQSPESTSNCAGFLFKRFCKSNQMLSKPGLCFCMLTVYRYWNAHLYLRVGGGSFYKNWINDHSKQKHAVQKLNLPLENRKFNELLMECNAQSSKLFVSWRCNQHAD